MTTTPTQANRLYSIRKNGDSVVVAWSGEHPALSGTHTYPRDEWQRGEQEPFLAKLKAEGWNEVV